MVLNEFTRKDLKELSKNYKYVVTAKDKMLSFWGNSENKAHYQIILCKDEKEKDLVMDDCQDDNTLSYVNFYPLSESWFTNILAKQKQYTVSLRNDWTRIYNK